MNNAFTIWSTRADLAQKGLTTHFAAPWPQFLNNWSTPIDGSNDVFNYWWLAHTMDVRLDAYERTSDQQWLQQAQLTRKNLLERNGGTLFNDYFDDMLWFGLALERLGRIGKDDTAISDAIALWRHCRTNGWNDTYGWSMAWRTSQLDYKNTPANGPFSILGARLYELTGNEEYLNEAMDGFDWITRTLRCDSGFIHDGINRLGDGTIDIQWRFTYNQGLYIGAGTALAQATGDHSYLDAVTETIHAALTTLTCGEVFVSEGDGGDEGLFKGIFYRYALTFLQAHPDSTLAGFMGASAEALWAHSCSTQDSFLPGNDWSRPPTDPIPYSTYLSAIMALEAMAALMG